MGKNNQTYKKHETNNPQKIVGQLPAQSELQIVLLHKPTIAKSLKDIQGRDPCGFSKKEEAARTRGGPNDSDLQFPERA